MDWLVTIVLIVALPRVVHADQSEWRIGIGGGGIVPTAAVGEADGTGIGFGARARVAYGVSDTIELGVVAGYARASDLEFESATIENQTGTLFADLSEIIVGAELRWTPGVGLARAFERTGPYVAARAGGMLILRTSQQLFSGTDLLLVSPSDNLRLTAFGGAALGIEHRFGDHLFLAAELSGCLADDERSFGLIAEAAWAWY